MTFTGLNIVGVIVAFGFSFVSGAIWFGPKTFFPVWWRLMGRKPDEAAGSGNPGLMFGLTYLGQLAMAFASAVVINFVIAGTESPNNLLIGLQVGLLLGVFVAAAASLSHRLFGGHGIKVWLIEVGNDIDAIVAISVIVAVCR